MHEKTDLELPTVDPSQFPLQAAFGAIDVAGSSTGSIAAPEPVFDPTPPKASASAEDNEGGGEGKGAGEGDGGVEDCGVVDGQTSSSLEVKGN